jgi:S-adenosylmethionine:tRNA ribosyltransferase-isomerase
MNSLDLISTYDFELPPELIARHPVEEREESRLLVIDRQAGTIRHHIFRDLPELLASGDLLVLNNTRVVPAQLAGVRVATGGRWSGLFLRVDADGAWRLIGHTRGKLQPGESLRLEATGAARPEDQAPLELRLEEKLPDGGWRARPGSDRPLLELLEIYGTMPLPHYMQRTAEEIDRQRYQTTFAEKPGAVAAPTAGLHFTPELLDRCAQQGISNARVTLHVGLGTFRPVNVEHLAEHVMHAEWCDLPQATVSAMARTRAAGGRVVAVGTTSVRTLESAALQAPGSPWQGETRLFIRPPFSFQSVDAMVTNFHLPRSTLLVLVSTFAGRDLILQAYEEAIRERYRFFSYGDAMLIL